MLKRTLAVFLFCAVSLAICQELELGPNLGRNSLIMAEVTERIPVAMFEFLKRDDVREELDLSSRQSKKLDELIGKPISFVKMQQEAGLDGQLKTLGSLSEEEAIDLQKKLSKVADAERGKFIAAVQDTLKDGQSSRLGQLLVQRQMLQRSARHLPRYGMPLPEELTPQQHRDLQLAVHAADQHIAKVELVKLKYRFYRAAFDDVLGDGAGEKFFGDPFGFEIENQKRKQAVNPRRR